MEIIKIKISPETLKQDVRPETYDGFNFGYYSGMTKILHGGVNGSSLLTGLTVPILLKQDYGDIGYYSVFDGKIGQQSGNINFIFSSDTENPYNVSFYVTTNRSEKYFEKLKYKVDWGDNSEVQTITNATNIINHQYVNNNTLTKYNISLTGSNSLGVFVVSKPVYLPHTGITISNPYGTVEFFNFNGSWATSPQFQNYISTGDSVSALSAQTGTTFLQLPFLISGYTSSQLESLKSYGLDKYPINKPLIKLPNGLTGQVISFNTQYTSYTINNVVYLDFKNGQTIYTSYSYGLTIDSLSSSAMTKNEVLLNVIDQPEIQVSGIIERGRNTGIERFLRIGEVGSIGDVTNYGYKFFNVQNLA
jgi:hypothetical protein